MSGMDRLTDEQLDTLANAGVATPWAAEMARELLAHRRASQAAPAPVAWQHVAASIQAHQIADDVVSGRLNRLTAFVPYAALKAAPAPSDGLREAAQALLDGADTGSLAELHHAVSDLFGVVDGSDQEDDLFNAILEGLRYTGTRVAPAPAQEGGK